MRLDRARRRDRLRHRSTCRRGYGPGVAALVPVVLPVGAELRDRPRCSSRSSRSGSTCSRTIDPNSAAATLFAAITLAIPVSAPLAEVLIANLDHESRQEYAARRPLAGPHADAAVRKHLVKPSMLPAVTMVALIVGELLGGVVITETDLRARRHRRRGAEGRDQPGPAGAAGRRVARRRRVRHREPAGRPACRRCSTRAIRLQSARPGAGDGMTAALPAPVSSPPGDAERTSRRGIRRPPRHPRHPADDAHLLPHRRDRGAGPLVPGVFTAQTPSPATRRRSSCAPSAAHWFGTDHLGRDLFARVVHGTAVVGDQRPRRRRDRRRHRRRDRPGQRLPRPAGSTRPSVASSTCCSPSRASCSPS